MLTFDMSCVSLPVQFVLADLCVVCGLPYLSVCHNMYPQASKGCIEKSLKVMRMEEPDELKAEMEAFMESAA
jgi:hypothetical protein